jgi:hypothetical protein
MVLGNNSKVLDLNNEPSLKILLGNQAQER